MSYIKKIALLLSALSLVAGLSAQKADTLLTFSVRSTARPVKSNIIQISKEDLLKFKSINEVLNVPAMYEVVKYDVTLAMADGSVYRSVIKDPAWVMHLLAGSAIGTRIIFTDVTVKKGEKQSKLEDRAYFIKE